MRILSILTYYHPHWTGLSTIACRVSEALASRGHHVTVLTTRHAKTLPAHETIGGVDIVRLTPALFVSRGAIAPSFPWRAARLIARNDVVHIHTPLAESLLVAVLCRIMRRPLLITHHGDLVMPAGIGNRIVESMVTGAMTGAARLAKGVTALSADYAAHSAFLGAHLHKVTAISPPVAMPHPDMEAATRWREQLGLSDARVVGFAGRFVEEKGFDVLLQALPDLVAAEPSVRLLFAGEHRVVYERFYERCRPLIDRSAGRVLSVGLLKDPQTLANFYALCDVLALPSRSDCFALVQLEAMLSGTPVVASDVPGAREVVLRTGMGRLVPAGDPSALASGLLEVLRDPSRFIRPRAAVEAAYSHDRSVEAFEAVIASLAERR